MDEGGTREPCKTDSFTDCLSLFCIYAGFLDFLATACGKQCISILKYRRAPTIPCVCCLSKPPVNPIHYSGFGPATSRPSRPCIGSSGRPLAAKRASSAPCLSSSLTACFAK